MKEQQKVGEMRVGSDSVKDLPKVEVVEKYEDVTTPEWLAAVKEKTGGKYNFRWVANNDTQLGKQYGIMKIVKKDWLKSTLGSYYDSHNLDERLCERNTDAGLGIVYRDVILMFEDVEVKEKKENDKKMRAKEQREKQKDSEKSSQLITDKEERTVSFD